MRGRARTKKNDTVTLTQRHVLKFVDSAYYVGWRKLSMVQRKKNRMVERLGRCLAFSIATGSFPPRAWGSSDVRNEWGVLQTMLRSEPTRGADGK